ncbi:MAG: DinB family protein, partial [Planctomycetota bacterium]
MLSEGLLAEWAQDARQRTLELVADLSDDQLMGPQKKTINPLLWELGHVAWFQEKWVLRQGGNQPSHHPQADALYDSFAIAHDIRWDLPLCKREQTLAYMKDVQQRTLEKLADGSLSASERDLLLLSIFHEDMHGEAFTYTRQTLGYPAPRWLQKGWLQESCKQPHASSASLCEDAEIPGGTFWLGATEDEPFVFDN